MKYIETYLSKYLKQGNTLLSVLLVIISSTGQLSAQTCDESLADNDIFAPFASAPNETCPGASDATWTLGVYDFFCSQVGGPDYPYNYSVYLNGIFQGDGTAAACAAGVAGFNSLAGLTAGDVVTLSSCGASGEHENQTYVIGINPTNIPNIPQISPSPTAFMCNGAPLTLSATETASGDDPWDVTMTYQWTLGGADIAGESGNLAGAPVPGDLNVTASGVYNVVIDNGCTITDPVSVTVTDITITAAATTVTDVSCFGESDGAVTVTAAGHTAYTYSWDGSPTNTDAGLTGLACGITFNVVVTATGTTCTVTDAVSLTCPPSLITLTTDAIAHESCPGAADGSITVTASGGGGGAYTFNWGVFANSDDGFTSIVTGLSVGAVSGTVSEPALPNCIATITENITVSPALTVTNTFVDPTCAASSDGSIDLTVTGGSGTYVFAWSGGLPATEDQSNLGCGIYTVTVNPGVCQDVSTITITCPSALTITDVTTHPTCAASSDGDVDITVTGGNSTYTYLWDNGIGAVEDPAGLTCPITYNVTVTDGNPACTITQAYNLTCTPDISITGAINNPTCSAASDGDVDVTVIGGNSAYAYTWSNAAVTEDITGITCATFDVTVIDNGVAACSITDSYTLTCTNALTLTDVTTQPDCAASSDGAVDITVTGGNSAYVFTWDNGLPAVEDQTNLACPITYNVTVVDGGVVACSITGAYVLPCTAPMTITDALTNPTCAASSDGVVDITVTGGASAYTYVWDDAGASITEDLTGMDCGTYSVTVLDNANAACSITSAYTITCPNALTITNTFNNPTCSAASDGSIDITITGGNTAYVFTWDNGLPATEDQVNLTCNTFNVTV
ncbi:MAG: SprB repeat-containing protein, partial [Flavobacteriales bacterium]|nr:SprB repeat-containing protein [Flavobacteriales bacterium]